MLRVDARVPEEWESEVKDTISFSLPLPDLQIINPELFREFCKMLKLLSMGGEVAVTLQTKDSVEDPIPFVLLETADVATHHNSDCRLLFCKNRYIKEDGSNVVG